MLCMSELPISGDCTSRFSRVRDAFAQNFVARGDLGAAVCITIDGAPVVDLWGGHVDKERATPWQEDTLVNVFSTTKGWTSACALRLVDQGKLVVDAPVAHYWPEFAAAGKENVKVGWLLDHKAGLPAVRAPIAPDALFDWEAMTRALAAETPWWEPGQKHGYHAFTFGWLVGEVIRRASGKTPGRYWKDEIAAPLGLDAHIGIAASEDARIADLRPMRRDPSEGPSLLQRIMDDPTSMTALAFINPPTMVLPGITSTREWRAAELPSVNGHATARAVARFYGALARGGELDGVRVLSKESLALCSRERSRGEDAVLGVSTRFGAGYMLSQPGQTFGPNEGSFGHPGAGGSLGFADPTARVGFGYVTCRMGTQILLDPRATALIEAAYACL
jgi:CubicO group peptidase (beta-lactamase class C family)